MARYRGPDESSDDGDALLLVGPIVAWLGLWTALLAWHVDDAGITYAYARNIGGGQGFRAHAEAAITEGFSNPAWTLLLALPASLGAPVHVASKVLQALAGTATLLFVHDTVRKVGGERSEGTAAALATAMCAPWAIWTAGGLETALLSFALAGFAWAVVTSRDAPAGLFAAIVALARPEGPVLAAALLVASWALGGPGWRPRAAIALPLLAFGAWLAVRFWLFDAWWPTAWDAKVTGDGPARVVRGALYASAFAGEIGLPLLVLGWGAAWWIRRLAPLARAVAVVAAADVAVMLIVGGDWMGHGRLLAHLVPLIAMASVPGLMALLFRPMDVGRPVLPGRARALAWLFVVAWAAIQFLFWQSALRHPPFPMAVAAETSDLLAALGPELCDEQAPRFATPDVGAALYLHPDADVLDLGGLTDRTDLGRNPDGWPDRLVATRPQLVLVHGPWVPRTGLDDGALTAAGYVLLCRREGTPGPEEDRFPPSLYRRADCTADPGVALLDRLDAWCHTWR